MMKQEIIRYPTIFSERNDEDGHYFVVTSPNIPGMVTQGDDFNMAVEQATDALWTMLEDTVFPEVMDPEEWVLSTSDQVVYIPVVKQNN